MLSIYLCCTNLDGQSYINTDSLLNVCRDKINPRSTTSVSDLLYSGIDNNLVIQYPDEKTKQFKICFSTQNGKVFETDDGVITIPRSTGKSYFITRLVTPKNDTLFIGRKEFTVVNVPLPTLKIGKFFIREQSYVDRRVFMGNDSLKLFFTDDIPESSNWYQIKFFTIEYSNGGIFNTIDNDGCSITESAKEIIKRLQPGKEMVIKVITITPTQLTKYLPMIRFRLQ